ncbi:MAG: hypothetical protein ACYTXA_18970 [Nostoc sp.]
MVISYWALAWCGGFDWQLRCQTTAALPRLPRLLFAVVAIASAWLYAGSRAME